MGRTSKPAASSKDSEDFVAALYADWLKHGRKAIEQLREEMPHIYVMTIASIVSDAED
jgi:hypothetical protein